VSITAVQKVLQKGITRLKAQMTKESVAFWAQQFFIAGGWR